MQKRGLSTIIVTLILILVSLVAVGIVWLVVRNVIQTGAEGVGLSQFSLNAKILDVAIDNSSNNVSLTIKRNAGKGELEGISFVFSSTEGNEVITRNVSLNELEQMKFLFHLNTSVSDLISVSIIPWIKQDEKEIPGIALDKYNLGKNQNNIPLGQTCVPASNPCGASVCGNVANGTCGQISCGVCGTGYNCVGGSCVLNTSGKIIPESKIINWSDAGVKGNIPSRLTICATLSPSGGDDALVIQTAINNCPSGQVVKLNTGTFNIGAAITVRSNITLRGSGMQTILRNNVSVTYVVGMRNGADEEFTTVSAVNIISGLTKGSTQITTSTPHNLQVNDLFLIDQLEDPSGDPPISSTGSSGRCTWCGRDNGNRPFGQVNKVLSIVNSTTINLETPIYYNYSMSKLPQVIKFSGVTRNAGIEDMYIDSSNTCPNGNYGSIALRMTDNCWVYNVEVYRTCRYGILLSNSYHNTIRNSIVRETIDPHTSNSGYQLGLIAAGSANLVENNIFSDGLLGIVYNGAISGNVYSYNYMTNMYHDAYPEAGWTGIASHGSAPFMNLIEGNYLDGPMLVIDYTWGSAVYEVYFRNRVKLNISLSGNQQENVLFETNSWYETLVGNVLGTVGNEQTYQTANQYDGGKHIYYVADNNINRTIFRHGNWDSVNNGVVWDSNIPDHNIPDSMYLSSKPLWFGSLSWPPIGPDRSPMNGTIPAKQRYDAI